MLLEGWALELRLAGRGLVRDRGFTTTAVLTLALGIAGTTAMFAVIHGILQRPLPVRDQDCLIVAWTDLPSEGVSHWPFRAPDIDVIRRASRLLDSVAGISYYGVFQLAAEEDGGASPVGTTAVTGDFFRVVGIEAILGRTLERTDDVPGAPHVLVITGGLWQRRYGSSRDVIGRRVMLSGQPFRIVGVVPRDVELPPDVEAWTTLDALASTLRKEAFRAGVRRQVDLVARLLPGVTIEQARGELQTLMPGLEENVPPDAPRGLSPVVQRFEDVVVGDVRKPLILLFVAVALVLFIASANVANLLLLRGVVRRTETAVRVALGASLGRLARQRVAESLLLALVGGVAGLAAASGVLPVVLALVPDRLPRVEAVRVDGAVALFTLAAAFLAAALASFPSVLRARRLDVTSSLRSGGPTGTRGGARRGRRALVVLQVALAVTIVAATGLLVRSLLRLRAVEPGLAADRLVFVELALPPTYEDSGRHLRLLDDLVARLEAAPGIERATPVNTLPFAEIGWDVPAFTAEGQDPERARANPPLNLEAIHPNYFDTLGVTLVRGRAFDVTDVSGSPNVAIVSEDLARRTWPSQDPIGQRLKFGGPDSEEPWRTVVAVVRPTRYRELAGPRPTLYLPAPQFLVTAPILVLRTASPLEEVTELARSRTQAVDPAVRVTRVTPFSERLAGRLARPRFESLLIGVFGLAALLLATVGLYAVVGAHVREHFTEIAVRMTLGATPSDVGRLVLGEGMRLAGLGVILGLAAAVAAERALRSLLFELDALDPVSLLGAALLVVVVSALASSLPALRATRVDPLSVLRMD